jgi:hypothetical protein
MMAGNFIEQLRKRQEAVDKPAFEPEAKPTEEMTDEELEDAIATNRRKLLDAQHAELRERELSRVTPAEQPQASRASLAGILREKQAGKRRTWR